MSARKTRKRSSAPAKSPTREPPRTKVCALCFLLLKLKDSLSRENARIVSAASKGEVLAARARPVVGVR